MRAREKAKSEKIMVKVSQARTLAFIHDRQRGRERKKRVVTAMFLLFFFSAAFVVVAHLLACHR